MRVWYIVPIAVLLSVASAGAQQTEAGDPGAPTERAAPTPLEWAGLTGSVRAGYWSSTRNLDPADHVGAGMIWIKSSRQLSDRVSFLVEGWTALRGPMDDSDATGEIREAFVDLRLGPLDLRLGRQIIAWGRADGVNPTDNLTAEDLTLLAPDDDDRRLGSTAVRASYYVGGVSLTGLWLPEFRGHRFPLPSPPPGLAFVRARRKWPGDQWGVRVEQTGAAVDWSVSYFRGFDLNPDLGLQNGTAASGNWPSIRVSHHRLRVVGADMAANAGRIGLRAEGAFVDTEDATGRDPFTKNPFVFLVVGGDRTFREYLNLNVQYLYRYIIHFRPARERPLSLESVVAAQQAILNSETKRMQHGASFRIAHKWLRETLEAECAAVGYAEPHGLALRPKVTYALSDQWKAIIGAEVFRGKASSLFGLLGQNSTAYTEFRWSF